MERPPTCGRPPEKEEGQKASAGRSTPRPSRVMSHNQPIGQSESITSSITKHMVESHLQPVINTNSIITNNKYQQQDQSLDWPDGYLPREAHRQTSQGQAGRTCTHTHTLECASRSALMPVAAGCPRAQERGDPGPLRPEVRKDPGPVWPEVGEELRSASQNAAVLGGSSASGGNENDKMCWSAEIIPGVGTSLNHDHEDALPLQSPPAGKHGDQMEV